MIYRYSFPIIVIVHRCVLGRDVTYFILRSGNGPYYLKVNGAAYLQYCEGNVSRGGRGIPENPGR